MNPRFTAALMLTGYGCLAAVGTIVLNIVDAGEAAAGLFVMGVAILGGLIGSWMGMHIPPPAKRR